MKRQVARNVNGSAPKAPSFNEAFPKGTKERAEIEAKIDAISGMEFLRVCNLFEVEQANIRRDEATAKAAQQAARQAKLTPKQ